MPAPDPALLVGTIEIVWTGCNAGVLTYDLPALGLSGEIPIERIVLDKVAACQAAQPQCSADETTAIFNRFEKPDDTPYHGSTFNKETGEVIDFKCRPTLKGLLAQLDKVQRHFRGLSIRPCYKASCVGYCLQRDLRSHARHAGIQGREKSTRLR